MIISVKNSMQRDLKKASGYYGCGCNTHHYLPVCAEGLKNLLYNFSNSCACVDVR